jgi:hypothetical protein
MPAGPSAPVQVPEEPCGIFHAVVEAEFFLRLVFEIEGGGARRKSFPINIIVGRAHRKTFERQRNVSARLDKAFHVSQRRP